MNRFIFIISLLFSFQALAQVEVAKGTFPFSQIVEWPRKGTLFLGGDPTGMSQEINFNLLNHEGLVQWNRSVYPKSEPTHLIISGVSDYVYFVDDLAPVNKFIRYNQVNESGSIVPAKFDMLKVIRDYGYRTPDDLVLIDIVNTQKSIIFYFQLPVKDKGIIENFFVTITHHNNIVYYCQGPTSDMELIRKGEEGPLVFAGSTEDAICFSRFGFKKGKQNNSYFSFTPKGKLRVGVTQTPVDLSPISSDLYFVGLSGKYHLQEAKKIKTPNTLGRGLFVNGRYYYVANDSKDRCLKIYGVNDKDEFVVLNECKNPAVEKKSYKNASLTFIPLDEKVIVVSTIGSESSAFEIGNNQVNPIEMGDIDYEKIRMNPSSFRVKDHPNEFVHFVNGVPYFTNPSTIGKTDKIIFTK